MVRQLSQAGHAVRPDQIAEAPWLWGVTDQTEPSMPEWMKDDEKWQARGVQIFIRVATFLC